MSRSINPKSFTYVVEHLDPDLEDWSTLEYASIAKESHSAGSQFILSSVSSNFKLPPQLQALEGKEFRVECRGVENLFDGKEGRAGPEKVCLLDPKAELELSPADTERFDVFLFGGILGDNPPRDRTSELRAHGYANRRLGPVQMTTDTAVRVTRLVIQSQIPLDKIPYTDFPELKISKNESTEMPFRYVVGEEGDPVMPEGMVELIKKDSEKGFGGLF